MICTGCGDAQGVIPRLSCELCQFCYDCLRHELVVSKTGPKFLAIFVKDDKVTLGYGLYISRTPKAAMEEAWRLAVRNGWGLLRLDVQRSITNIFVYPDYHHFFKASRYEYLPYDAQKYGTLRYEALTRYTA